MTDLTRHYAPHSDHADSALCGRHAELFDEGELTMLHVISVRLEHGLPLAANQRDLLARCAWRVRRQQDHGGPDAAKEENP